MKIHWLQHVSFEGLGSIEDWANTHGHILTSTRFYLGEYLPPVEGFDMLVVMGGPMSIHDEKSFPWLKEEKRFIGEAVEKSKPVLGICLGAQLIADVLGAEIRVNHHKEIGWFPITKVPSISQELNKLLPDDCVVLHWHGETFSLPPGSEHLFTSAACQNQGFLFNKKVIGLQFHIEIGQKHLPPLIENCRDELIDEKWVQSEDQLLVNSHQHAGACRKNLFLLLDYLSSYYGK